MKRTVIVILALFAASTLLAADAAELASRRARLAKELGPNAMLILFSPRMTMRNGDVEYPYRQSDDLIYLTGITEPETTLVMIPGDPDWGEVVFTRQVDPQMAIWGGGAPTADEITKISGIRRVLPAGQFRPFLNRILMYGVWTTPAEMREDMKRSVPVFYNAIVNGKAEIWLTHVTRSLSSDTPLTDELSFAKDLSRHFPELHYRDAQPLLVRMREVKSPEEIATLQRAIDITIDAQKAAMARALTAVNERELDAIVAYTYISAGAQFGFPSITAAGPNTATLHYMKNDSPVDRNGLVLTDLGAEVEGYSADVTRTYPANGTFSADQRAIYQAVFDAQAAGIAAVKAGAPFGDVQRAATASLGRDLLRLGLITKEDPKQVYMYFRHGVGHPIGLDVHDMMDLDHKLAPNMVITVEPGVYVRRDDVVASPTFKTLSKEDQDRIRTALDRYNGIGVRIEDDVLVTDGAPRVLSEAAPKTVNAIETFMARASGR